MNSKTILLLEVGRLRHVVLGEQIVEGFGQKALHSAVSVLGRKPSTNGVRRGLASGTGL
jgi:hypothetical protein